MIVERIKSIKIELTEMEAKTIQDYIEIMNDEAGTATMSNYSTEIEFMSELSNRIEHEL